MLYIVMTVLSRPLRDVPFDLSRFSWHDQLKSTIGATSTSNYVALCTKEMMSWLSFFELPQTPVSVPSMEPYGETQWVKIAEILSAPPDERGRNRSDFVRTRFKIGSNIEPNVPRTSKIVTKRPWNRGNALMKKNARWSSLGMDI